MITFSYCLDAAGNLIKLDLTNQEHGLIPFASELVSSAEDLMHPRPWTKSVTEAVNEVRFVPAPHVAGTLAQQVHETRKLPRAAFVFVPRVTERPQDNQVVELIDLYDELPEGHEGRQEIVKALSDVGVQLIPLIGEFHTELHAGKSKGPILAYTKPGWLSHSKVYRKALVA
ncbi:hypothetical protein NPS53_09805 [Pseudomonas putida]|uniref:hypothetical protein n=1 Tax=Pseudomonas putida TaxID=303 RepID=UPI002363432F|nr:hypothetical protein [Pseudomonas putida]MDD2139873.1 hypothetical protein [Pseudomonas putida]HDS1721796.1 hypothetical protein [Pseudomonas putida]